MRNYSELPEPPESGYTEEKVTLAAGESAVNPTRSERPFYGPCTVVYRVWYDGGIDSQVIKVKPEKKKQKVS